MLSHLISICLIRTLPSPRILVLPAVPGHGEDAYVVESTGPVSREDFFGTFVTGFPATPETPSVSMRGAELDLASMLRQHGVHLELWP